MTGAASAPTTFDYSVFGLHLRSELALPELLEADGSSQPHVMVSIGSAPKPPAAGVGPHPVGGGLLLAIPAVARYFVKGGSSITIEPEPGVPEANVRLFLLGSAMGALLHQRGLLPLHANAVEIGGRAFAFMGASGSGKSTLAAWFHDHGYRVIADDVCVIRFDAEQPVVAPGLPRLRLWKEALEGLGRHHAHYSRSYAGDESWDKFDVPLPQERAVRTEMDLFGIYLLDKGDSLSISPLQGLEATEAVFANTYRGTYVPAAGNLQTHWESCLSLVRGIPIFRLRRAWDVAHFAHDVRQIIAHAEALASRSH